MQLPFREAVRLQSKPELSVNLYPQAEIYMLQIPSYVDAYQNKDVRNALHMAIDKAALGQGVLQQCCKALAGAGNAGLERRRAGLYVPVRSQARDRD